MLKRLVEYFRNKIKKKVLEDSTFDLGLKENLFDQGKKFDQEKEIKEVIKSAEKSIEHKLIIRLTDKEQTTFTFTVKLDLNNKSFPFKEFYKWYLTKETPHFVYEYDDGSIAFKRSDIKYVQRKRKICLLIQTETE